MNRGDNPYRILGVSPHASQKQIKRAYHKAALRHHPDKQLNESDRQVAHARFTKITHAYRVLSGQDCSFYFLEHKEIKDWSDVYLYLQSWYYQTIDAAHDVRRFLKSTSLVALQLSYDMVCQIGARILMLLDRARQITHITYQERLQIMPDLHKLYTLGRSTTSSTTLLGTYVAKSQASLTSVVSKGFMESVAFTASISRDYRHAMSLALLV